MAISTILRHTGNMVLYTSEYSPLSRLHVSNFKVDGNTYNSLQQYTETCKADFFYDLVTKYEVLMEPSPRKQRSLGEHLDSEEWNMENGDILLKGMEAKANQVNDCYDLLLSTGSKVIVEAGVDGIGLHINDPNTLNPEKWINSNYMGKLWMIIRHGLQSNELSGKNVNWDPPGLVGDGYDTGADALQSSEVQSGDTQNAGWW